MKRGISLRRLCGQQRGRSGKGKRWVGSQAVSSKSGYVNVWLRLPWGNKSFPVHRLVCIAFHGIEGYKQGLFVDHIDTNRANNHADNLRWVTPKENSNNPLTLKKRRKKL